MVDKTTSKLITVEEYEQIIGLPENQDRLLELIDGEIVEKVPTLEHGVIASVIIAHLYFHVKQHGGGFVATEASHRKPGDNYNTRLPDVSVTKTEMVKQGSVPKMPELAIEIKSPDDTYAKIRKKGEYYLRNGSKMSWLFFPVRKEVEQLTLGEDGNIITKTFTINDTLSGEDVLPGFELPLKEIFGE